MLGKTRLERMEEEAGRLIIASGILNIFLLIVGTVCISMAYQSWEVGIGVAAFLCFMKGGK